VKSLRILVTATLLASLSVACSSDDKKSSTGAGKASCDAYCSKLESSCADAGVSVDIAFCSVGCEILAVPGLPAACDASAKVYYDCLMDQSDVCKMGCTTQEAQYSKDCGGDTDAG
jgi:hypothetical protein